MSAVAHARNLIGPLLTGTYRLRLTGAHHLPTDRGVVIVAEQQGLLDPTILATGLPRPVRVMGRGTGSSMRWATVTSSLGRIDLPSDGSAWEPLQEAAAALRRGEAVSVFLASPFGPPILTPPAALAAYLQAGTGAPVVAVSLFGSAGRRPTDLPRPRSTIECHIGEPVDLGVPDDPRSLSQVRQHAERIRQVYVDAHARACRRTGRTGGGTEQHNGARD